MKFNWRVLIAFVVLVGAIFWGVDSVRTRSYSGTDLSFGIGSGPVSVTNSSDAAVPVQLVGTGTRSFSVSSPTEGVSGSSSREGSGRTTSQLYEFELPPGISVFTVTRGSGMNFVASTNTPLEASVQPLNSGDSKTTIIVAVIVLLGTLFYLSRTTGHRWISHFRRVDTSHQDTQPTPVPVVATADSNMGRDGRMYTDA